MCKNNIFLSSTYIDLQPEREAVRDAIFRLQQRYAGMEYFGSEPELPRETSLRFLRRSTVYVGVVAHRYGTIDSDSGKSYTQLEYEEARGRGMPMFLYFKDPATRIEPTSRFVDFDRDHRQKLSDFKDRIASECTIQMFSSPGDLGAKVTADLAKILIEEAEGYSGYAHRKHYDKLLEEGEGFVIPMVGAVNVGKTVYSCVLANEPIARLSEYNLAVAPGNLHPSIIDDYQALLEGEWARKTSLHQDSHVELTFQKRRLFGKRTFSLRIQDLSGEFWTGSCDPEFYRLATGRTGTRGQFLQALGSCCALALFVEVQNEMNNFWEDHEIFNTNVLAQLERIHGVFNGPVAVILTKCDLVPELLGSPESAESYVRAKYPFMYRQMRASLGVSRFFVTSAVGAVDGKGQPQGVNPIGIWEPISWILGEL